MSLAIVIVITLGVVAVFAIAFGRPLTLSYKGMKASVEQTVLVTAQTAQHVQEIKRSVGTTNGAGDIASMVEEIRAEMLTRTQVTREGRTEPEALAAYTQDRMHDVLAALQVISLQVQTMWRFLQEDYPLPDLSTVTLEGDPK